MMSGNRYIYQNDKIKLIIEEDVIGYYLVFYDDLNKKESKEDYLVKSLEEALQEAKDRFGISNEQWSRE